MCEDNSEKCFNPHEPFIEDALDKVSASLGTILQTVDVKDNGSSPHEDRQPAMESKLIRRRKEAIASEKSETGEWLTLWQIWKGVVHQLREDQSEWDKKTTLLVEVATLKRQVDKLQSACQCLEDPTEIWRRQFWYRGSAPQSPSGHRTSSLVGIFFRLRISREAH